MRSTVTVWFVLFALTLLDGGGNRAHAEGKSYPYQKPPGPIAGQWKVSCNDMAGMVVEVTVNGVRAMGTINTLGAGGVRFYKQGEEILQLTVDDFGQWSGKLVWRSVANARHEDAIRFVATQDRLDATMTTDDCFKNMSRVR